MHLFTCEIYICETEEGEKRFKNISEMKDHIKNEHGNEYNTINHSKQSRADSEDIDMVQYSKAFFITNY